MRVVGIIVTGIFVAGILVLALLYSLSHQSAPVARKASEGLPLYQMNQQFSVGYWTYTIYDAGTRAWIADLDRVRPADSGNWVLVDLTVRNDDNTSSNRPVIALVDDVGREFSETETYDNRQLSQLQNLNPGVSKRGLIFFDAPRGPAYRLKVSGGLTSGVYALVNLIAARPPDPQTQEPPVQPYAPPVQASAEVPRGGQPAHTTTVQSAPSADPISTNSSTATPAPITVETQSAAYPSQLQFAAGVRLMIRVNSITRQPDGSFTFRGTLLQPVALTGAVSLDQSAKLAGSVAANARTVSVTGFTVSGRNYELQSANGSNKQRGSGPAVELDPGKVLEMWFASASIYEKTTGVPAQ